MTGTYYEILGVPRDATDREIKHAYRTLARKFHPDICREAWAEERFRGITEAYRVLSDPGERTRYDRLGHERYRRYPSGGPEPGGFREFRAGFRGFEDIFDLFFSEKAWGPPRSFRPRSVLDILVKIEITLEEAILGTEREIEICHAERCASCRGTGSVTGKIRTCPRCKGTGTDREGGAGDPESAPCGDCGGRGSIPEDACRSCRGWGANPISRRITLRIPPGIDSGMRIRREGLGEAGDRETPDGDLYVEVTVLPHARFTRHGLDLETTLHLSPARAALGCPARVESIDGRPIAIEIPPGIQHDGTIRVVGGGVKNRDRAGDLLVRVKVDIPSDTTPEEHVLYERLLKLEGERAGGKGKGMVSKYLGRIRLG